MTLLSSPKWYVDESLFHGNIAHAHIGAKGGFISFIQTQKSCRKAAGLSLSECRPSVLSRTYEYLLIPRNGFKCDCMACVSRESVGTEVKLHHKSRLFFSQGGTALFASTQPDVMVVLLCCPE